MADDSSNVVVSPSAIDVVSVGTPIPLVEVVSVGDAIAVGSPILGEVTYNAVEFTWPESEDWLRVYAEEFSRNQTAYVESAENNTIYTRKYKVVFRGDSQATADRELIITQDHFPLTYAYEVMFESSSVLSAAGGSSTLAVQVTVSRADTGAVLTTEVMYPTVVSLDSSESWVRVASDGVTLEVDNRGIVAGDARSVSGTFGGALSNGDVIEGEFTLVQEANAVVDEVLTVELSQESVVSSGGSLSYAVFVAQVYTSGLSGSVRLSDDVYSVSSDISWLDVSTVGEVVVSSRGSELGDARSGSFVISYGGMQAVVVVRQDANTVVSEVFTAQVMLPDSGMVSASGGLCSLSADYVVTFSSGSIVDYVDSDVLSATAWSESVAWLSVADGVLSVSSRGTEVGEVRSGVLEASYLGILGNTVSSLVEVSQAANAVTDIMWADGGGLLSVGAGSSVLDVDVIAVYTSEATRVLGSADSLSSSQSSWLSFSVESEGCILTVASRGSELGDVRVGSLEVSFGLFTISRSIEQAANVVFDAVLRLDPRLITDSTYSLRSVPSVTIPASGGRAQVVAFYSFAYSSGYADELDVSADTSFTYSGDPGVAVSSASAMQGAAVVVGTPVINYVNYGVDDSVTDSYVLVFGDRGVDVGDELSVLVTGVYGDLSATALVIQDANLVEYMEPSFSVSYDALVAPAEGMSTGAPVIVEGFSQLGVFSSGAELVVDSYSSDSVSCVLSARNTLAEVSLSQSGVLQIGSLGTSVQSYLSDAVVVSVSIISNGVTGSALVSVPQEANEIVSRGLTITRFAYEGMLATDLVSAGPDIASQLLATYTSGSSVLSDVMSDYSFGLVSSEDATVDVSTGIVTWSENQSTSPRSLVVSAQAEYDGLLSAVVQATLEQASGEVTYGVPQVSLSYADATAAGGSLIPVLSYSQSYGYNGDTTGGGVITDGAALSFSGIGVDSSTGVVTVTSKGTEVSGRTEFTSVTVSVTMNGITGTAVSSVYQAENVVTGISNSAGNSDTLFDYGSSLISASGGDLTPTVSPLCWFSFSSGSRDSVSVAGECFGGVLSFAYAYSGSADGFTLGSDGVVTALDRSTVEGVVRGIQVTLASTATWGSFSSIISQSRTVSQAANVASYGAVSISGGSVGDIPAAGGTVSSASGCSASQTVTYTSGSTRAGSVSISWSTAVSVDGLGTTDKARTKVGTLTATASGEGGLSATKSFDVYQAANVASYGAVSISGGSVGDIPASGGTVSASGCSASQTVTYTSGSTRAGSVSLSYSSVSADSLGTTDKARAKVGVSVCTAEGEGGLSATKSFDVYQEANYVSSYSTPSVSLSYAQVGAGGGTATPSLGYSQVATYKSGSDVALTSGASVSYDGSGVNTTNGTVSVSSKGTDISNATTVTTATVTVSMNGKSSSVSASVTQAGNYVTNLSVSQGTHSFGYAQVGAGGGTASPSHSGQCAFTYTFSSGATSSTTPSSTYGSVSDSYVYGGSGVDSINGTVSVSSKGTDISNATEVTMVAVVHTWVWTPSSSYSSQGSKSASHTLSTPVTQAGNYVTGVTAYNNTRSFSYGTASAAGGSLSPSLSGSESYVLTFSSGSTSSSVPSSTYGSGSWSYSYSGSAEGLFSAPNGSTGVVSVSSKGTTISDVTSGSLVTRYATFTWTPSSSYNGGTKSGSCNLSARPSQARNCFVSVGIRYGGPSGGNLSALSTGAAGGVEISITTVLTVSSGAEAEYPNATYSWSTPAWGFYSYYAASGYCGGLAANSRGTVVGDARSGAVSVTCTDSLGVSVTGSLTLYQDENVADAWSQIVAWGTPSVSLGSGITAGGGSTSISASVSNTRDWYYSSNAYCRTDYPTGTVTGIAISSQYFSTSSSGSSASSISRFSISGSTLSHSSMTTNVGYDFVVVLATNADDTSKVGYSSTLSVQNSYSDSGHQLLTGWSGGGVSFSSTSALSAGADSRTVYIAPWSRSRGANVRTYTSGSTTTLANAYTEYYTGSVSVSENGSYTSVSPTSYTASSSTASITLSKSSCGTTVTSATIVTVSVSGATSTSGSISQSANNADASSVISSYGGWVGSISTNNDYLGAGADSCTITYGAAYRTNTRQWYYTSGSAGRTSTENELYSGTVYATLSLTSDPSDIGSYCSISSNSYTNSWSTDTAAVSKSSYGTTYTGSQTYYVYLRLDSASGTAIASTYFTTQVNTYSDSGGVTTYGDLYGYSTTDGNIPASGGSATSYASTANQDWSTSAVIRTFTSGSSYTVTAASSGTITGITASPSSFSGSAGSKGTTESSWTQIDYRTCTWSSNGKSASDTLDIWQYPNSATHTSTDYSASISADAYTTADVTCPASGGSCTLDWSASYRYVYTWSSGSTSYGGWTGATPTISGGDDAFSRSGTTVSIASRGSTTGDIRSATFTASYGTASSSVTIYQQANWADAWSQIVAWGTPYIGWSGGSFMAVGGSQMVSHSVTDTRYWYYTSNTYYRTDYPAGSTYIAIVLNGGNRFSLSGNTVIHSSMGEDAVTDSVVVRAYNSNDTSKYADITDAITNSSWTGYSSPSLSVSYSTTSFTADGGTAAYSSGTYSYSYRTEYSSGSVSGWSSGSTSVGYSSLTESGSATGFTAYTNGNITAEANSSSSSRSLTRTFSYSGVAGSASTSVTFTQAGVSYNIYIRPTVSSSANYNDCYVWAFCEYDYSRILCETTVYGVPPFDSDLVLGTATVTDLPSNGWPLAVRFDAYNTLSYQASSYSFRVVAYDASGTALNYSQWYGDYDTSSTMDVYVEFDWGDFDTSQIAKLVFEVDFS